MRVSYIWVVGTTFLSALTTYVKGAVSLPHIPKVKAAIV